MVKPSIFNRVKAAFGAFKAVMNWYEGGQPFAAQGRSYIPSIVQDARFDQNFVTRRELLRKARYFSQNNPVIKRIIEVDQTYTIGPNGLHLTPMSSDPAWNERAKAVFAELCQTAGLDGEDLTSLMQTAHHCESTDGEAFFLKTRRKYSDSEIATRGGGMVVGSRPCVQLIEAHRVETPFGKWNQDGDGIIDGVQTAKVVLPDGRRTRQATGYWVRSSFGMWEIEDSFDFIPKSNVIHIGEAQRAGQTRFISRFYASMNVLHDFDDLLSCEMKAAKDGAEKSTIIETPSGELNVAKLMQQRISGTTGDPTLDAAWKERIQFYQQTLGGRTVAIKTGDKITQYLNNRPTVTSREYWLFLLSVICAGYGVSILLVFPDFSDNSQGTAVRAELDIADSVFMKRGRKWRRAMADVWEYFMGWAIYNDSRVVDPPADWRRVVVYPPKSVNVDVGRQSQAMLAELAAGATDYEGVYGPLGLDWRERLLKLKEQQDFIKDNGINIILPGTAVQANQNGQPIEAPPTPKKGKKEAVAA